MTTTVTAEKNSLYDTDPGNDTTDKVFLLSITEVKKYFSSNKARKCAPTDYAIAQGADTNTSNGLCCWWLRSPGITSHYAAHVGSDGSVSYFGDDVNSIFGYGNYGNYGNYVRTALWINLG